jgi:hypothetical protein
MVTDRQVEFPPGPIPDPYLPPVANRDPEPIETIVMFESDEQSIPDRRTSVDVKLLSPVTMNVTELPVICRADAA